VENTGSCSNHKLRTKSGNLGIKSSLVRGNQKRMFQPQIAAGKLEYKQPTQFTIGTLMQIQFKNCKPLLRNSKAVKWTWYCDVDSKK
jgi:hypothetical protein